MTLPARAVIVGLGNPVRGDDAAGLVVAETLRHLLAADPVAGAVVHEAARGGFELIDAMAGADEAVIVDCLDVPSAVPGRVRILTPADVAGSARLTGGHDIAVNVALDVARLLRIKMPERVVIVGIEGADTTLLRDGLTPEVAAAAAHVAQRLHAGLRIGFRPALDCFGERPCASRCAP